MYVCIINLNETKAHVWAADNLTASCCTPVLCQALSLQSDSWAFCCPREVGTAVDAAVSAQGKKM